MQNGVDPGDSCNNYLEKIERYEHVPFSRLAIPPRTLSLSKRGTCSKQVITDNKDLRMAEKIPGNPLNG